MDTNMEDVGRVVEPSRLSPVVEPTTISTLDGWIESLMTCKQLAEVDVQRLCEKVRTPTIPSSFWVIPGGYTWFSDADSPDLGKRGLARRIKCTASCK
jgi:hypothetical protein